MSGQLGDGPPPAVASPKKQPPAPVPAPSSTPAPAAVDSKPVVEAADLTPAAPEAKVAPADIPSPALIPPDNDTKPSASVPLPECTPQEIPHSEEQKQPLAPEPVSESVIHPEHEAPVLEDIPLSIPTIPVEQQQSSSEKMAENQAHPETEPCDADQQTQSATVGEIPAVAQQLSSFEKAIEEHPQSQTELSHVKQQELGTPATEIPAVHQQQQNSSENVTEDLSAPLESEIQNVLNNTGLEKTTAPTEVKIEPNPKITESEAAASLTDNVKVNLIPDVEANSIELKPALITETVSQEVPPELEPKSDSTATNEKQENTAAVEPSKPAETSQMDESQTTAEVKAEPVPELEKAVVSSSPPVEAEENVSPADKVLEPKPDETQQDLKLESESPLALSENKPSGSGSEEETQARTVETKPTGNQEEPPPPNPAEEAPPVAANEGDIRASEKTEQQNAAENEVSELAFVEEELAQQKIPQRADVETSVEIKEMKDTATEKDAEEKAVEQEAIDEKVIRKAGVEDESFHGEREGVQNNAATVGTSEVKADKEKAFEKEATKENTTEKANDQKPDEEEVNKAQSGPAPASDTEKICLVEEKKEPEIITDVASTVAETQIQKLTGTMAEPSSAEKSLGETVSLSEKSEEKETPVITPESAALKEAMPKDVDTVLKAEDEGVNVVAKSEEEVIVRKSVPSVQMASGLITETQAGDKTSEEKLIQDETETASQTAELIAENPEEMGKEASALTGNNEKTLEKVAKQKELIKDEEEKLDKKETVSQPVAGDIQEPASVSETSTVCDKDGMAGFDVPENTESKMDEVSETAQSVASVSVAEPEIPASVVSEQDEGPQEESANMEETKEAKAQSLGKPSDEDAVTEVTIAFRTSVSGSCDYLSILMPTMFESVCTEMHFDDHACEEWNMNFIEKMCSTLFHCYLSILKSMCLYDIFTHTKLFLKFIFIPVS